MQTITDFETLTVGDEVTSGELVFTRDSLVRYAGASLDFNPIHYSDEVAKSVGLPGVLAHGMLTMGAAASVVTDNLAPAVQVSDYQVRFTRPVPVEIGEGSALGKGSVLSVTAVVGKLDEEAKTARIDLKVQFDERTVLGKSQLFIKFDN